MAYNRKNLSALTYANGFTQWHYTTTDASVTTAGYFNSAANQLRVGDLIVGTAKTNNDVPEMKLMSVASITADTVTVTAL